MTGTDKLTETHDRLVEAVAALSSGEDWKRMLEVARRFHNYSANNVLLIQSQRPDATRVAGYKTWKGLGRQVRAGEHGIAILAPCIYRSQPTEGRPIVGFRPVPVFDLAQTEGTPLEEVAPAPLVGDAPNALWSQLASQVIAAGFNLLRADCRPANATTHFLARTVVVRPDLSPAQAAKSLCHELAHVKLHDGSEYAKGCRDVVEVEAESVAYLVCAAAELPTEDYSFPYVARWANGDPDTVRRTADRVITCARGILAVAGIWTTESTAARER